MSAQRSDYAIALSHDILNDGPKLKLLDELAFFSKHQLLSKDVDPVYPMLRSLYEQRNQREGEDVFEANIFHTLLYVAYYSLASAQYAMFFVNPLAVCWGIPWDVLCLSTGIERRGLRGGTNMETHLRDLQRIYKQHGSFRTWLTQGFGVDPRRNWQRLQETLQEVKFNGRWAAYKTGEILYRVHDFPVEPTDMGMAFSSGPRWGLALFFGDLPGNTPPVIRMLDDQADTLLYILQHSYGLDMGIEQLETMLCDFHSLHEGRYYVGHDIDQIQEQLLNSRVSREQLLPIWEARASSLPHTYLGELEGWTGVDKARKQVYKQTGKILVRA